jgi:hypothetical protein
MERLLLLWDDLDDFACACRHVAASAAQEVVAVSAPMASTVAAVFSSLFMWLFLPR